MSELQIFGLAWMLWIIGMGVIDKETIWRRLDKFLLFVGAALLMLG